MALQIGISGKRHLSDDEKKSVAMSIEATIRDILARHQTTDFTGLSSLAIGTDTVFAEVVVDVFHQPLKAMLPMAADEYAKDFESADLAAFHNRLAKCSATMVTSSGIPQTQEQRDEAYFQAGRMMVDDCDEMIFVWDEQKPRGRGGTAEIMSYYSKSRNAAAPEYIRINPQHRDPTHWHIAQKYASSDVEAIRHRDRYRKIAKLSIFLGWLAVIVFATATAFEEPLEKDFKHLRLASVCVEFGLIMTVVFLVMFANSRKYHDRYLAVRLKAELLRIVNCYYHADLEITNIDLASVKDPELSAIIEEMNQRVKTPSFRSKWYARYTIRSLIENQITYHQAKIRSIGTKDALIEKWKVAIVIAFILNLFAHLIEEFSDYFYDRPLLKWMSSVIVLLSISLPPTYAALEGYLYFQEWQLLKSNSQSLLQLFNNIRNDLDTVADESDWKHKQKEVLDHVTGIMLTDNQNWKLVFVGKDGYCLLV